MNCWALSLGILLPRSGITPWSWCIHIHYWSSTSFENIGANGFLYQHPQLHFPIQIQNYPSQFHQGHLPHEQPIDSTKQVSNQ